MSSVRNTIGADIFDQNLQYVSVLSNALVPAEYFNDELAEFCDYMAYHCDIHSISMPIVLLNIAATSTEKSGIWRSNVERFPLNLYSLIVANSAFGKSKLLRLIAQGLQIMSDYYPDKFKSIDSVTKGNCPVYNDATCAGMIASVNGCTRVLISEEADMLLPSIGAILPSPFVNKDIPTVKSDARAELMKMFDGDWHIRKLKGGACKMNSFKHSFAGASSGGIIITALQRKSNGSQVDAFFERLIIWCLRPEPLMFVPESEKRKPQLSRFPTFEEFCIVLGLFENFEMSYDDEGDKMMVDFGNRYTKLAFRETDRYLMAKIGKMIQLAHRLTGLVQVLEWTWEIIKEYLIINGSFVGVISEEFISDIRSIFDRFYRIKTNDKNCLVATVASVKHSINISEALLEQYKMLMHLPNDIKRISGSNNSCKVHTNEHAILNPKLDKSKMKLNEHIRNILLFKSVIFTPTTLYKSPGFKHNSENVNSILNDLSNMGLLVAFKNGIISTTKKAVVYAKWLPKINDNVECQRFEQMLATFNDDKICADSVVKATTTASLSPHQAVPQPVVLNYLNSDRYSRLHLDLNDRFVRVENLDTINESDEESNSSAASRNSINGIELHSVSSFRSFDKAHTTSASGWQHEKNDCGTNALDKAVALPSSVNDDEDFVQQQQLNAGIDMPRGTQSSIVVDNIFDTIGSSQTSNRSSKRKTADSLSDVFDDNNEDRRDVRIRSSNDTFKN